MNKKSSLQIIFFILLVSLDQLSKYLIRLSGGFSVCNKNLAFGIQLGSLVFYILWTFIIFTITYLLARQPFGWNLRRISYVLMLAGAFGNMLDRIFFGCVLDFIDLKFWPIFNLADVFITAGVILLIMKSVNIKNKSDK